MHEEFQTITWTEPPMNDLVGEAVAKGRRIRTARRLGFGGAAGAVLVVTGLATSLFIHDTGPSMTVVSSAPAAVVAAAPSPSASSPVRVAETEAGRVQGTPAGLLELLLQNLPKGRTSHYAGDVEYGDVSVQTFLDRGKGPGMIRLHVMTRKASDFTGTWIALGNGTEYMVKHVPGNCYQNTIVWVHHPDNTLLQFDLSNCPELLGVKTTRQILTAREAAQVGADPRWGVTIDPALNDQGAAAFPHLPEKFGK